MKKMTDRRALTAGLFLLYLVAGSLILKGYQYQINPDAISYINIAKLYIAGEWRLAANSHWHPLSSWLLIPFLRMGWSGLTAVKVLNLLIGGGALLVIVAELRNLGLKKREYISVLLTCMPILWWMAYASTSPDLLLAVLLLEYVAVLFRNRDLTRPGLSAAAGAANDWRIDANLKAKLIAVDFSWGRF